MSISRRSIGKVQLFGTVLKFTKDIHLNDLMSAHRSVMTKIWWRMGWARRSCSGQCASPSVWQWSPATSSCACTSPSPGLTAR